MAKTQLKKVAVKWGKSAGVLLPKEYIGQEIYILTNDDIENIKTLKEVFK